jgi:hypothetical protein
MRWTFFLLGSAAALCGCGDASDITPPPAGGALGQVDVRPECGALSQACLEQGLDAPLAVGAAMGVGIDYDFAGNAGPSLELAAVDPSVIDVDGAVIAAQREGLTALLIRGPEGEVIDFIHVWAAAPNALHLVRHNDQGAAVGTVAKEGTLLVGDEVLISVEAFSETQALLGLFDTSFSIDVVDGVEPVAVVEDIVFGWYRLIAREPGHVLVQANALNQTRTIDLEVLP